MGLNIFDYIKWNGDMNILAYRHPKANLGKYTKLQVTDAQEAVVVVNGESMQKFGPGTHELDSPNVPEPNLIRTCLLSRQYVRLVRCW